MAKKQNHATTIVIALVVIIMVCLVRHFHIKNFQTVLPGVLYTSGQPKGMDYTRLLYKYHLATIVNLRQIDEHREDHWYNEEMTWVKQNSVNYVPLPVTKRPDYFPPVEVQREFMKVMADTRNLPVLLHSSSGRKRVSMLTAVWLVKAKGYSVSEAVDVLEKIKGKSATKKEKQFIEDLAKKTVKKK